MCVCDFEIQFSVWLLNTSTYMCMYGKRKEPPPVFMWANVSFNVLHSSLVFLASGCCCYYFYNCFLTRVVAFGALWSYWLFYGQVGSFALWTGLWYSYFLQSGNSFMSRLTASICIVVVIFLFLNGVSVTGKQHTHDRYDDALKLVRYGWMAGWWWGMERSRWGWMLVWLKLSWILGWLLKTKL